MSTKEIINHCHIFEIEGNNIELLINCKEGQWSCKVIKGAMEGFSSLGGVYFNLNEYIEDIVKHIRYDYYFYKYGYSYAKKYY